MAISKASRRGGRAAESVHEEPEGDAPVEAQPTGRRKVLPTKGASDKVEAQQAKNDGATHVMLTRAVVDGRSLVPGERVKLSPAEAAHLAKQGAVKAL